MVNNLNNSFLNWGTKGFRKVKPNANKMKYIRSTSASPSSNMENASKVKSNKTHKTHKTHKSHNKKHEGGTRRRIKNQV